MSFHALNSMKNASYYKCDMLTMRIEYIFIRFLYFMSYKISEQKTVFLFNKDKKVSSKVKEKFFNFFFVASITCHIYLICNIFQTA